MSKIKLVDINTDTPLTVEDAKRVQRLVEHLQALRKHRDFLSDKRAGASRVILRTYISDHELPPSEERRNGHAYVNDFRCEHDSRRGWYISHILDHGTLDDSSWTKGYLPTIDTSVMHGVRAAVADEIVATESAITAVGFAVPK
jgi:hypothetical protein